MKFPMKLNAFVYMSLLWLTALVSFSKRLMIFLSVKDQTLIASSMNTNFLEKSSEFAVVSNWELL